MRPQTEEKFVLSKEHLVIGILLGVMYHDARIHIQNKTKFMEILEERNTLQDELNKAQARVKYLAHMIDRSDAPVTEFDFIALQNPIT